MTTAQRHKVIMPQTVHVRADSVVLEGELYVPDGARGVIVFLHGGGSSRHSPRDRSIANELHKHRFATFLFDLLTVEEEAKSIQTSEFRFNVGLLAKRVAEVTDVLVRDPIVRGLPLAYVATSTGAAAAIMAAADVPGRVAAIISRGGCPDLADAALGRVEAPTLLIVGSKDSETLERNQGAFSRLHCEKELRVVAGASHLFDEAGAIEQVEGLVVAWLERHLQPEMAAA